MPVPKFLSPIQQNTLQKALRENEDPHLELLFLPPHSPDYNLIELVWHSCKEFIAHRLFKSVDELRDLLDRLTNQGELNIQWKRKIKNKGNAVPAD